MKKNTGQLIAAEELRRRAEALYDEMVAKIGSAPASMDIPRLVHELQVHQIELEMQNEELQRTRAEVETWLERYTELYDFAPVGFFTLGRDGAVIQANLHGAALFGLERSRLVGRPFGLFLQDGDLIGFDTFLGQVFTLYTKQTCEVMLHKEDGERLWVQVEAVAVEGGDECRVVVIDIHDRKLAEQKLQYMSMHDSLTGLYNRSFFEESMQRLERGRHFPVSILMADVDGLKITNDQLGHAAGDDLLIRVAQVLMAAFRIEDVIARIGGDEFAVLLPDTNVNAAEAAVARLEAILIEHNSNFFTENQLILSLGISTATVFGNPLMETLREADARMYAHKGNKPS